MNPSALPLFTERLVLRPLGPDDRAEFIRTVSTLRTREARWLPARPPGETPDDFFDLELDRSAEAAADGTGFRLVAAPRESPDRIAGFFNLNNIVRGVFQNADAGWSLSPDSTGRGLATEALTALLDLAFAPEPVGLALHRVQANIRPENTRSIALAARVGLRHEGLAREMLKINGDWRDHEMYAKLAREHRPVYLALLRA
ncbi:MAG: GNAT family N-acetyltransferase [Phycisphaeraceae bacterium]|nr:GNAT family N-acetyltransferase [Phycisphaeraceae bacterium]